MGVDISFHIEVHKGEKWLPFIWQTPVKLKSYIYKKDEGKEWMQNDCCFWCRYYHFSDFVDEHATRGLPEDASMEMKEKLSKYEMGNWYFLLSDLSHFYHTEEEKMLSHLIQSRDYQLVKQLNRIEKFVKHKPLAKKDTETSYPYGDQSIKEIYNDFNEEFGIFLGLIMAVRSFLDSAYIYAEGNEVRILYGIC